MPFYGLKDIISMDSSLNAQQALVKAIFKKNIADVRKFLDQGADVQAPVIYKTYQGFSQAMTPLIAAINTQDTTIINLLLERGADIESSAWDEKVIWSKEKTIMGFQLHQYHYFNEITPLVAAIKVEDMSIIELLLNKGAKLTPVKLEIQEADIELDHKRAMESFSFDSKIKVFSTNSIQPKKLVKVDAINPLAYIMKMRTEKIIRFLKEEKLGYSANEYALSQNFIEGILDIECECEKIFSLFIKKGAYIDANSFITLIEEDKSAIWTALEDLLNVWHCMEAFNLFFKVLIPPPLHLAASYGDINLITELHKNGHSLNENDILKRSVLHVAVIKGHTKIVDYLIRNGVNVNAKTYEDATPLHYAVTNVGIVQVLLNNGADMFAVDLDNDSPLDWAVMGDVCIDTIALILAKMSQQTTIKALPCFPYFSVDEKDEMKRLLTIFLSEESLKATLMDYFFPQKIWDTLSEAQKITIEFWIWQPEEKIPYFENIWLLQQISHYLIKETRCFPNEIIRNIVPWVYEDELFKSLPQFGRYQPSELQEAKSILFDQYYHHQDINTLQTLRRAILQKVNVLKEGVMQSFTEKAEAIVQHYCESDDLDEQALEESINRAILRK